MYLSYFNPIPQVLEPHLGIMLTQVLQPHIPSTPTPL